MLHIFGLKVSVKTVFSAWKSFSLQKYLWAENLEVNCKQPVKYLVFHVYYLGNVIVLHSFLLYRLMLQVSSLKSGSWIACISSLQSWAVAS